MRKYLSFAKKLIRLIKGDPNKFLKQVTGVIHVGANIGQERFRYSHYGLDVIWIEPIPLVFNELMENISPFQKKQQAFEALVLDTVGQEYEFHIANNGGASSSIFEMKDHKEIWPEVHYKKSIKLKSTTLSDLLSRNDVDLSKYQALVMDTQGSELLVLKGSLPIINNFTYILTEASDFEIYKGCCTLHSLKEFLSGVGFKEVKRIKFASKPRVGSSFNVLFKKKH